MSVVMCATSGKVRYARRRDAVLAVRKMAMRRKAPRSKTRVHRETKAYRCPACGSWHLTTP